MAETGRVPGGQGAQRQQQKLRPQGRTTDAAFGLQMQFGHLRPCQHSFHHIGQLWPCLGQEQRRQRQALHLQPGQIGQRHSGDPQLKQTAADAFGDKDLIQDIGHAARVQIGAAGQGPVPPQRFPIGAHFGRTTQGGLPAAQTTTKRKDHDCPFTRLCRQAAALAMLPPASASARPAGPEARQAGLRLR